MLNRLHSPEARLFVDAIRSGQVQCRCFSSGTEDKQEDQLGHHSFCMWQRALENIYAIGRSRDGLDGEVSFEPLIKGWQAAARIENLKREEHQKWTSQSQ